MLRTCCPYLEGCRSRLEAELLARLPAAGVPGDELLAQYAAGGSARVRLLLGAATPTVAATPAVATPAAIHAYIPINKNKRLNAFWIVQK